MGRTTSVPAPPLHRRRHAHRPQRYVGPDDIGCRRVEAVRRHAARHPRQHGRQVRVVEACDHAAVERRLVGEIDEGLLQVLEAAVVLEVLVVDVRNHRNRWKQFQKRSVALVCLGDHELTLPEPRVAAERSQPSADHRCRIQSRSFQHQRDHRRGRRLAVRPGDRNGEAQPHELREHLGPGNHRHLPARRLDDLRVRRPHRRRDDHDVGVADVRGVVPHVDADAERPQPLGDRRSLRVRSTHHVAEIRQQLGDAAHPDAANPDEVHVPGLTEHGRTRRVPGARCR